MFSSVHNYYENLVFQHLLIIMKKRGETMNNDLMEDVACIALNHLPPRYIRHNVDMAFNLTDEEQEKMNHNVIKAVNAAIESCKPRPI